MKQKPVKSKVVGKLLERYGIEVSKKDTCVICESDIKYLMINNKISFFYYEDSLVPTLRYLLEHEVLPKITVDMGAVKFVVNGADIMRPGIVEIEDGINENDFIVIIDVNNKKPLAVGIALFSSSDMKIQKGGRVIKNIHYVGDEIWNESR